MKYTFQTLEIDPVHIVYKPIHGIQNMSSAFESLFELSQNLGKIPEQLKMLTAYQESFKQVSPNKALMWTGFMDDSNRELPKGFLRATLHGGLYISGHFELDMNEFQSAWEAGFAFMQELGFSFADQPPYEIYHNNYMEHPEKKSIVDLYIPVKP